MDWSLNMTGFLPFSNWQKQIRSNLFSIAPAQSTYNRIEIFAILITSRRKLFHMSSWSPVFGIKSQITKFQSSHVCNSHFSSGIDYHPQYTGYRPGTRIKQERKVFL